jgi:1-deoxy-D-xylulose-5-phosphate reductoisomerase
MNKGFEVIEACHLFSVPEDRIDVVVHRESIIHSMVEYIDHSILAQLAVPDMRLCIQNALTHPMRVSSQLNALDLASIGKLSFYAPDEDTFVLLRRARQCIVRGGALPAVLNAANEVAVAAFLENKIRFGDISDVVDHSLAELSQAAGFESLEEILEFDRMARETALSYVSKK